MQMNSYIEIINRKLDEFLPIQYPENIFKSMKYTLMLPGKRLRPILCLETCAMLGGNIEDALPAACAVEMLHAQTLIHDDLPCMDNDDYRRGELTNHKVFGEAIATLACDALLTWAPHVITKHSQNLSPSVIIRILNEYFHFAGANGVIAGQTVDIECENNPNITDKEQTLYYLHLHKTSDLFQLAVRIGAIIAEADDDKLDALSEFAQTFGLAFQVSDDILDEISTFDRMGKTIGKDKLKGKLTYVSLYGLEDAKCKLSCLLDNCCDIIKKQNLKSEIIEDMVKTIRKGAGI